MGVVFNRLSVLNLFSIYFQNITNNVALVNHYIKLYYHQTDTYNRTQSGVYIMEFKDGVVLVLMFTFSFAILALAVFGFISLFQQYFYISFRICPCQYGTDRTELNLTYKVVTWMQKDGNILRDWFGYTNLTGQALEGCLIQSIQELNNGLF